MYLKHKTRNTKKIFIELKKFKNIQEPRVEKHTFSRTIQEQIKFKRIQEHSRISRTSGHLCSVTPRSTAIHVRRSSFISTNNYSYQERFNHTTTTVHDQNIWNGMVSNRFLGKEKDEKVSIKCVLVSKFVLY